jgi:hypothetical protein
VRTLAISDGAVALGMTPNGVLLAGDALSVPTGVGPVGVFVIALDGVTGDQAGFPARTIPSA